MKRYILILPAFLIMLPWFVFAHGMGGFSNDTSGIDMMRWGAIGGGWFGFWAFIAMLGVLVWLIVGILAAVWLWRQISKNNK